MSSTSLSFLEKSKNIFSDIILLYKNFFHWNISKCIIAATSFIWGVILCLPFAILLTIILIFDPISWFDILAYVGSSEAVSLEVLSQLLEHPFYVLLSGMVFLLACLMFVVGNSYGLVLETNLYLGYIRGKKIPYLGNYYFHLKSITQYVKMFSWGAWYMFIPFLMCLVVFILLYTLYFSGILSLDTISWVTLMCSIVVGTIVVYIAYRISFMYMIFVDRDDMSSFPSAKDIVQESIAITKGKVVFSFMFFVFLVGIILLPYSLLGEAIEERAKDTQAYLGYKTSQIQINTQEAQNDFQMLEKRFSEKTDTEVVQTIVNAGRVKFLYIVLGFLFIEGVFHMMLVSFYIQFLSPKRVEKGMLGSIKNVLKKGKNMLAKEAAASKATKKNTKKKKPTKKSTKKTTKEKANKEL